MAVDRSGQRIDRWTRLRWYLMLTLLSLLVLAPIYFLFVRAISDPSTAFTSVGADARKGCAGTGSAEAWDAGNLGGALTPQPGRHGRHHGAQVVTSVLAAYAFAFLRFPLKRVVFAVFMATLLLPLEVTLLPNLAHDARPRLVRLATRASSSRSLASAFGTFLIRQGFLGIPDEIRDAARLEGSEPPPVPGALRRAAHPTRDRVVHRHRVHRGVQPVPVAPRGHHRHRQLGHDPDRPARPRPVASRSRTSPVAGAVIAAVPIVIVLVLFQRHIVRGLTAGAVKG